MKSKLNFQLLNVHFVHNTHLYFRPHFSSIQDHRLVRVPFATVNRHLLMEMEMELGTRSEQ